MVETTIVTSNDKTYYSIFYGVILFILLLIFTLYKLTVSKNQNFTITILRGIITIILFIIFSSFFLQYRLAQPRK